MDGKMPKTNIEWIFFFTILIGIVSVSALSLVYQMAPVLAQHEYILTDLPREVHEINSNVIRICQHLELNCNP